VDSGMRVLKGGNVRVAYYAPLESLYLPSVTK
jgi:hypothetical protein